MANIPSNHRRRSWLAKSKGSDEKREGQEFTLPSSGDITPPTLNSTLCESPVSPSFSKRWSTSVLLTDSLYKTTLQNLDLEASQLILNAFERSGSTQPPPQLKAPEMNSRNSGSFSKMAFSSMMGGFSALSLSRSGTAGDDKESRGRSILQSKRTRSSSAAPASDADSSLSRSRARSQSPFSLRRFRSREMSPTPQPLPLSQHEAELYDSAPASVRPQTSFTDDPESGDEIMGETDAETEDEDWDLHDTTDSLTERNTESNAFIPALTGGEGSNLEGDDVDVDPDPLGEGVNVVVPPEPYFPSTLNNYPGFGTSGSKGKRNPRKRKSSRYHEALPIHNSRPVFQRDRCTIVISQGEPDGKVTQGKSQTFIVASDLSDESRYALEWGIGTVLRDGDEMILVTIVENESKGRSLVSRLPWIIRSYLVYPVDPPIPNAADRAAKLRSQQEVCFRLHLFPEY
jgi:hypothetical protein